MKKLLILFFLFISLTVQATDYDLWKTLFHAVIYPHYLKATAEATTYYIATAANGGSNSNNGSSGSPWLTLAYASTHTASGDIIYVNAGTYTETSQISLPVGVSIEGAGVTSIIACRYNGGGAQIRLVSSSVTNGNQHISNIKFDGNYPTTSDIHSAINVTYRSNVSIYNCTISNFLNSGIEVIAQNGCDYPNTTICTTGNSIHDCIFTNCAQYYWPSADHSNMDTGDGRPAIRMDTQDGMLIYNNNIDITQRTAEYTGYFIKGVCGYNKNCKIYNNTMSRTAPTGVTYDFALEFWNGRGGNEIYNNDIVGGSIDISGQYPGNTKGSSTYSTWIHDNSIGNTVLPSTMASNGVLLENSQEYVLVERNHIYNVSKGIYMPQYQAGSTSSTLLNITLRYNILENIGGYGIYIPLASDTYEIITNLSIYNNVTTGTNSTGMNQHGISTVVTPLSLSASGIRIRNNIVKGFSYYCVRFPTVTSGNVQNNIFYGNGYSDAPLLSGNFVNNGNLTTQPPFVSTTDFHLTAARNGLPIADGQFLSTNTVDYDNVALGNPPEIGAYEYGSFTVPTVTTTAATNIAVTSANCGGNITSDGGATITERGVCYGASANPTTSGAHVLGGTGTGVFTLSLSGLTSYTLYHFRAYATNSQGTSYGSDAQFTTLTATSVPTVTVLISSFTTSQATTNGNVTSDGGASVTARGVCWSTSANPSITDSHTTDGTGTGAFTSSIVGLSSGTLYHVRAYATNSAGTAYSSDVQFTTNIPVTTPVLTTTAVSTITITTAVSGGVVTSAGGGSVTSRGIAYSTSSNPTTAGNHTTDGSGIGSFVSSITGLIPNTLYYVRAYAVNQAGTSYGSQVTFTTSGALTIPVLTTSIVTITTMTSATAGGNITSDGGAEVTDRGVCWGTSFNPDINGDHSHVGTGTGTFSVIITGLTNGTQYHVRAWATNSEGTNYGSDVTFTPRSFIIMIKRP